MASRIPHIKLAGSLEGRKKKFKETGAQRERVEAAPEEVPGLIWAIWVDPAKEIEQLESKDVLDLLSGRIQAPRGKEDSEEGWAWLHFNISGSMKHSQGAPALEGLVGFPEEAHEILFEKEHSIDLEGEDGIVWGSFPAFDHADPRDDRDFRIWRFAMRDNFLITTRRAPVPVLGMAYTSLSTETAPGNPAELIDKIISDFTVMVRRQLDRLDDALDKAEDLLLSEHRHDHGHMGSLLGKVRRRCAELRRVLSPIDRVLRAPDLELPGWSDDALRDRGEQQVHAALDDLLALQDRSKSLQDELASSQAEETNQRLYMVSLATTLMLPATFVTGFFGMNTGGMFFTEGVWGTIEAGIVCVISMILTWVLLKVTKLL